MSCGRLRWVVGNGFLPVPWVGGRPSGRVGEGSQCPGRGHLEQFPVWGEEDALAALAPCFSPDFSLLPTQAQGSKDGKPKQKVIIADCGEYM